MVEANPYLSIINNVGGFANLLAACDHVGTPRLVHVSTDKAVRPTNVMGASKRVCELLLQNRPMRRTRCAAVRFGNEHEIAGYVRMGYCDRATAFDLVEEQRHDAAATAQDHLRGCRPGLASGAMAEHGEIFILDMGEPVRIADLARQLIFLSGRSETEVPILQRLARRGRGRRCPPALLSAHRAFGDGRFLLPGARPGHPEAQNAPEPAREAQNGVDSRSGFCKLRKRWSKVRFRSETKPERRRCAPGPENQIPIPYPYSYPLDPKTQFLSLVPTPGEIAPQYQTTVIS